MKGRLKFSIQASRKVLSRLSQDPRLEIVKTVPHLQTMYAMATEEDVVELKMENQGRAIFGKTIPFHTVR